MAMGDHPSMGSPFRLHCYSFQEYLALEEVSTVKHEFLDGEIYTMAGGSVLHAALSAAMVALLHAQTGRGRRVYSFDLRVRVQATGMATYADATVVCGPVETDPASADTVINPAVLVEVLSPSTIDYDLGEKCAQYKQIPTTRAIVHVWQDQRRIAIHERKDDSWHTRVFGPGETASVDALGCRIDVDTLYTSAGGP
jgi:Uma2 family endonuclease